MLNHVIVFSNKSLRRIFAILRLYKIRYSMLENKKNPVFIGVSSGFEFNTEVDITQVQTLSNYLKKHPFEGIINCAAYTQVDQAETDADTALKINSEGVRTLIQFAEAESLKLIHFSTVFFI